MSCDGKDCSGGIDCQSGCTIEEFNEHAIASDDEREPGHHAGGCALWSGQPCDCGHQPGERPVGPQAVPTLVTPPKYGPPPGFPAEKWRTMNRAQRREQLKSVARAVNQVVK